MAMNIYQKTKVIMLESNKCITIYNKLAKILVESADITLNDLIDQIRKLVCNGRIIGNENRALYGEIRTAIMAYCDAKINEIDNGTNKLKENLKIELKILIEEYKVRAKGFDQSSDHDEFSAGCTYGRQDELEEVIDRLEELIK